MPVHAAKSNVFVRSSAQSTRGVLFFCGSFLAAASSATLAPPPSPGRGRPLYFRRTELKSGGTALKR